MTLCSTRRKGKTAEDEKTSYYSIASEWDGDCKPIFKIEWVSLLIYRAESTQIENEKEKKKSLGRNIKQNTHM